MAEKTIYGWENGQSQPDADTLMFLCELYNIDDVLHTFGYKEDSRQGFSLSSEEKNIIIQYRNKPEMQEAVRKLLDIDSY